MRFGPSLIEERNTTNIYIDGDMRWLTEDGILISATECEHQPKQATIFGITIGKDPETVFDLRIGTSHVFWRLTEKAIEKKLFELGYRERVALKALEVVELPAVKCPVELFTENAYDYSGPEFISIPVAIMPETELDQSGDDFAEFMATLEEQTA